MNTNIDYHKSVCDTVIKYQSELMEAPWLHNFNADFREFDTDDDLFALAPPNELPSPLTRDVFNLQHPLALEVYAGAFGREIDGGEFELFARGAALVAVLYGKDQASLSMDFIRAQVAAMDDRIQEGANPYPLLDEQFAALYSSCLSMILLGEETTNWRSLLNFVMGSIWMIGFTDDNSLTPDAEDAIIYYVQHGTFDG